MGLTNNNTEALRTVTERVLTNKPCALYLFGSRLNDRAKGGDIDLLLLLSDERYRSASFKRKLLNEIHKVIGDQRIDLIIADINPETHSPFVSSVLPEAQLLNRLN